VILGVGGDTPARVSKRRGRTASPAIMTVLRQQDRPNRCHARVPQCCSSRPPLTSLRCRSASWHRSRTMCSGRWPRSPIPGDGAGAGAGAGATRLHVGAGDRGVRRGLAGAISNVRSRRWAQDPPPSVRTRSGVRRRPPCEATIRRVLQLGDSNQLDRAVSAWARPRHQPIAAGSVGVPAHRGRGRRERSPRPPTSPTPKTSSRSGPCTGPAVMATLRNLAISLHRLAGAASIASAAAPPRGIPPEPSS